MIRTTFLCLLLAALGCRPHILPDGRPEVSDALALWSEIRQAHTGGLRLLSLRGTLESRLLPGLQPLMQLELDEEQLSRVGLDFAGGTAWQLQHGPWGTLLTTWDGHATAVLRNGHPWTPPPGVDRSLLVRSLMWLLRPSDAALQGDVEVSVLPPEAGRYRLQFAYRDGYRDRFVLEVHPRTFLVTAIEHSAGEFHVPYRLFRVELEEYRNVGDGILVPHRLTQYFGTAQGKLPWRVLELSHVQVSVESAFPPPGPQPPPAPGPHVHPPVIATTSTH